MREILLILCLISLLLISVIGIITKNGNTILASMLLGVMIGNIHDNKEDL